MRLLFLVIFLLFLCCYAEASPFLVSDPYQDPNVTISAVEIRYTLNGEVVTQTGTYTVVDNYVQLYDFNGDISGMTGFQARWGNGANWSDWANAISTIMTGVGTGSFQ
jgi:hypothetical protein